MNSIKTPLIDDAGEVREISLKDLQQFQPAEKILSSTLQKKLGVRGHQRAPTKERISIRLSPDVLRAFRAKGPGWQSQIDEALKDWLDHNPS